MKLYLRKQTIRRVLAVVLCAATLLLLVQGFSFTSEAAAVRYYGDVNEDGILSSDDSRLLLMYLVDKEIFTESQLEVADVDHDGAITSSDARLTLNLALTPEAWEPVEQDDGTIPMSGYTAATDTSGTLTYTMKARYSDTYTFACTRASSVTVSDESGRTCGKGTTSVSAGLTAGQKYTVSVKSRYKNTAITVNTTAQNHQITLPFEQKFKDKPSDFSTTGNPDVDPLEAVQLSYSKRQGGTYVYSNNPERLAPADIGQALMRDKGLTGRVNFTLEHSNSTGSGVYLGYQLKNEGTTDVHVTVTNIGYQVTGEWLGQKEWSDYYNQKLTLPEDYFTYGSVVNPAYQGVDFVNYTPRVYQPMTYKLPAGKYMYVLGGTTQDAYLNYNVGDTANKALANSRCANGVVNFIVTGGSVTGTLYCYTSSSQVAKVPAEQGYVCMRGGTQYGAQYKGTASHQGVIESNLAWTVNDNTACINLPVSYETHYDGAALTKTTPYQAYTNSNVRYNTWRAYWYTNIGKQNSPTAVASDMVSFTCRTTDGKTVTIDDDHADGRGDTPNIGNWMIEYQDNYTLVNQGDRTRSFKIRKSVNGCVAAIVLDADGNILATKAAVAKADGTRDDYVSSIYTLDVAPHSVKQVTVIFVLLANSYGNVTNAVELIS